jgi:hypothetical protein
MEVSVAEIGTCRLVTGNSEAERQTEKACKNEFVHDLVLF